MEFFQANIHLKEVLVQLIAFVIVFWALRSAAWGPVMALLRKRREKIESDFHSIAKGREDLEALRLEYQKKLSQIDEEARAKLQDIVQEGKKMAREIQDSAREQAKEILDKSKEDIALEADKARVTLRREIAGLVFAATERLVKERLGEKKDEEMILQFIKELEQSKAPFAES